jgi:hypothetical protein
MRPTDQLQSVTAQFRTEALAAANAKATYKSKRAQRKLEAQARGEAKSDAAADTVADADETIAALHLNELITAALAESTKQKIYSLREDIGYSRTLMANERAADQIYSTDRNNT